VTAHLGDETAVWTKGAVDSREHRLLTGYSGDPVEGGVGEDGVELVVEGKGGGVVKLDVEIALAGGGEHGGGGVYADEDGSGGGELLGEGAVATAQVEYSFAWLWVEECDDIGGESGDEAAVGGVGFGVPGLAGLGLRGGLVCAHKWIVCCCERMREEDKNLQKLDKRQGCRRAMG
jgi:hypothetical protein